jgi:hypothetical protein
MRVEVCTATAGHAGEWNARQRTAQEHDAGAT